jgi:hypothetical protein
MLPASGGDTALQVKSVVIEPFIQSFPGLQPGVSHEGILELWTELVVLVFANHRRIL